MAAKVTAAVSAKRMTVEEFTRSFILKARGDFAGVNSVATKHQGFAFNEWYRSYYGRGLLEESAPESPIDATKALEAAGKLRIGRGGVNRKTGHAVGVYLVLPEDAYDKNAAASKERVNPLDALTI